MSLGRRTVSGAFWTSLARICQHGMSLVSASVLARLLTPSIYGVVGMVTVIIGFISIFRTLGTATLIEHRPDWLGLVITQSEQLLQSFESRR